MNNLVDVLIFMLDNIVKYCVVLEFMSTIFDVARLANVSIKTVSRVANGEASVRLQTRAKVKKAIAQLNYTPHKGARMMRSSKSGVFGMITSAISSTQKRTIDAGLSSIHIIRGAQEVMKNAGKLLMIADTSGDIEELDTILSTFISHSVDGVIIAAEHHQQIILPLRKNLPIVIANGFDAANTPAVIPDDFGGQFAATQYLIKKGHQRIGMIGLNDELIASSLRRDGFYQALHTSKNSTGQYNCGVDSQAENQFSPLPHALDTMLHNFQPSAICFGNDIMAMRARALLSERGIEVPASMSIIGFDNDVAICESLSPALTTINLPYLEIGASAAKRLLSLASGNDEIGVNKIPCDLVLRSTVQNI